MQLNQNKQVRLLIVGLGLLGGSYAKALTEKGYTVNAISRRQSTIDYALSHGMIASGSITPDPQLIQSADMIIFGLYPHTLIEWLAENGHLIRPGTVVTDVTGVKSAVVYRVQEMLPDQVEFIAAHPMAGKEVYGVENSDASIFKGANYIVTPTEKNTPEAIEQCKELGRELGFAHVSCLSPEEHDRMIGFVSQLTHCIAVSLMTCSDNEHLADYTGDSFRDLTRIASINDEMWSELFLLNKQPLLDNMDLFLNEFHHLRDLLAQEDRDGLRERMRLSTKRRQAFNQSKD